MDLSSASAGWTAPDFSVALASAPRLAHANPEVQATVDRFRSDLGSMAPRLSGAWELPRPEPTPRVSAAGVRVPAFLLPRGTDSAVFAHGGGPAGKYSLATYGDAWPLGTHSGKTGAVAADELGSALRGRTNLYSSACNDDACGPGPEWYDEAAGGSLRKVTMAKPGALAPMSDLVVPGAVLELLGGDRMPPLSVYEKSDYGTWEHTGPRPDTASRLVAPAVAGASVGGAAHAAQFVFGGLSSAASPYLIGGAAAAAAGWWAGSSLEKLPAVRAAADFVVSPATAWKTRENDKLVESLAEKYGR